MDMDNARYNNFIKTASNVIAKFLWACSIWFSVFGLVGTLIEGTHLPTWLKAIFVVIAVGLGITVTILELMANRRNLRDMLEKLNVGDLLLFAFQILAYVYDGYTNIAGLTFFVLGTAEFFGLPMTPVFAACIFFGLLIAGGPEPMLKASMDMRYVPVPRKVATRPQPTVTQYQAPRPTQGYGNTNMTPEQLERLRSMLPINKNEKRQ